VFFEYDWNPWHRIFPDFLPGTVTPLRITIKTTGFPARDWLPAGYANCGMISMPSETHEKNLIKKKYQDDQ
jgi:hypothetical protein